MRIALPIVGGALSAHFGHCENFAFYNIDEGSKSISSSESLPSPEHQPGLLPRWLAENGATVVIAGGMGPMAVQLLEQNGIKVVLGATENDPEKAVLAYLGGVLESGDNVCNHGDGDHECAH